MTKRAMLVAGMAAAIGCSGKPAKKCDDHVEARRTWITTASKDSGGQTPETFRMSATGPCADDLRVQEDDCSLGRIVAAYGAKPFTAAAQRLGFRTLSCGTHVFEMPEVTGEANAAPTSTEPARLDLAALDKIRRAMCACADRTCAGTADAKLEIWERTNDAAKQTATHDDNAELARLMSGFGRCRSNAMLR